MNLFAAIVLLFLGFTCGPATAQEKGNAMCKERTAEASATELMKRSPAQIVRVLVRLKISSQDRMVLDDETARMATAFYRDGALIAEPIGGQPFIVVEIARDQLLRVARHLQVACISEDTPGTTQ